MYSEHKLLEEISRLADQVAVIDEALLLFVEPPSPPDADENDPCFECDDSSQCPPDCPLMDDYALIRSIA